MALSMRTASGITTRRSAAQVRKVSPICRRSAVVVRAGQAFDQNWLKVDPVVLGASFLGWTIPSNIPTSAFGGASLFGLLTSSIGEELAHWPTGPALTDKFWLYLLTWHIGLFVTMLLGQVGAQGRKQGYW